VSDIGALIAWLLTAPRGRPVEDVGATAMISAISGTEITVVMQSRGPRELTQREQQQLQALGATTGYERRGTLYAGDVPAAATTAVLLPHRIPAAARRALGIGPDGAALPARGVPLGRALRGLGVRREPLQAVPTPAERDADGNALVICSTARLWLGCPIAIVTERVYQVFLAAYPGPWPYPGSSRAWPGSVTIVRQKR
jgi:hypothetical protein